MPSGMAFVEMSSISTSVPLVLGTKKFGVNVGSSIWPVAGGVVGVAGRMSYSGWPVATAAASPTSEKVTLLEKAEFRVTSKVGPSTGEVVVAGRAFSTGGWVGKSGIVMTVPL